MLRYYIELLSKPQYQLSLSEKMFVDCFPLIVLLVVSVIIVVICSVIEYFKKHK